MTTNNNAPPPLKVNSTKRYDPGPLFWSTRQKGPSHMGIFLFSSLRILDLPLQYFLLHSAGMRIISRLGGAPIPSHQTQSALGLSPYLSLILLFALGATAKQLYWLFFINNERFPPLLAAGAGIYNSVLNTINTLLALWSVTSQSRSSISLTTLLAFPLLALILYPLGLYLEWYSEIQRHRFKIDPANKGKPFSGGLFGLARHINYGGYTLWRTGYALYCGGWVWGIMMTAWLAGDFVTRAIPSMDVYCEGRYGEQWVKVRREVKYKLIPWVY